LADSLIIKIDGDSSAYQKELNKVKASVEEVNKIAKKVAVGVGVVGGAVVGIGVKYNAEMEQYKAGLTTLLGSAEQAEKTLADLKSFAAKTPFELTDLAQASNTLLAFGEDVNNLMPDLKMLGDISLGNQEKFKSLALVFGQVQSQGKLMGQDLLQMINAGFNPLKVISEQTGESMSDLKEKMAEGQISFEMVAEAMRVATSEGGQFYNAMETQSKTLTGQISTLKDNVNALFGEMTTGLSENLTEDILPWLIEQVEDLNKAWEEGRLQEYIKGAAVALTVFGSAVVSLNIAMVAEDIFQLAKGTKDFTAATKLGTSAQKLMNLELMKNPYTLAAMALAALVAGIVTYAATHKSASDEIIDSLDDIKSSYNDAIKSIDEATSASLAEAESVKTLKNRLYELEDQLNSGTLTQEEANDVQEDFKINAEKLGEIIPDITSSLYDETGAIDIQRGSVDDLVNSYYDLAVAKATANAYQEKLNETAKALIDAKESKKEAEINKQETDDKYLKSTSIIGAFKLSSANKAVEKATADIEKYQIEQERWREGWEEAQREVEKLVKKGTNTLDEGTKKGNAIVTTGNATKTKNTKKAAEDQTEILKKQLQTDLDNLKYAREFGKIEDKEYYEKLAEIRNAYFKEGDKEWNDYTLEIYRHYTDTLDKATDKALEDINKIAEAQDRLSQKLQSSGNRTFQSVRITSGDGVQEFSRLADVDASNRQLEKYNRLLDQLYEKREDLPDIFSSELANMEVDDAISYLSTLLNATDEEFNKYMADLDKNQELADKIGKKVLAPEAQKIKEMLEEHFGKEVPETFFDIGEDSAAKYGEGFMQQLKIVLDQARETVALHLNEIGARLAYAGAGNVNTSNYYDSRTTNIYAPSNNPHTMIEAQRQNDLFQQHTSPLGG